jgi:beta-lactamase regulating signal transducer with metallopeptidase domain
VIPERFLTEPGRLRIALAHELAHIRRRDPQRAHAVAVLRALAPWHPALALWARWLGRLEELACDEHVLARGLASPRLYGECLLWAADAPPRVPPPPGLAIAMVGSSRTFLERRIAMLLRTARTSRTAPGTILFAVAALAART